MSLTFGVRGRLTGCKASPETSNQYHRQHFSPRNVRNDNNDNLVPLHNNSINLMVEVYIPGPDGLQIQSHPPVVSSVWVVFQYLYFSRSVRYLN